MFGVSRKKPLSKKIIRNTTASASSSSDEDANDEEHRRRYLGQRRDKTKKNKKECSKIVGSSSLAAVGLSFNPDEHDEEEEHDNSEIAVLAFKKRKKHSKHSSNNRGRSKKNKCTGGFGYGGSIMMKMDASDESASDAEHTTSSQYYNVAALQQLKMEQKHGLQIGGGESNYDDKKSAIGEQDQKAHVEDDVVDDEQEFIPLSDTISKHPKSFKQSDPIVLTGDEALAFAENEEAEDLTDIDHGLRQTNQQHETQKPKSTQSNELIEEEVEEGNRQWEDTMARRAGVLPSASLSGTSLKSDVHHRNHRNKVKRIAELKGSLKPTMTNLENVSSDLATNIHRHQSTIVSTKDELTKFQGTLQHHGKALEYYQDLRADLATWIGALRELDRMVSLAEEALRRWERDVSWTWLERFFEWGEDCTNVLEKKGLLESIIKCSDNKGDSGVDQPPEVDEFGRSVSSMSTMARIKRLDRRRKMQSQRCHFVLPNSDNYVVSLLCINEDNFDLREIDEWKQRYKALNDAVALIPNSVKEDYRSISNLFSFFLEWHRLHPEDYKTSFAEMSLVKMASVLVRLESCSTWDMMGLSEVMRGNSRMSVNEVSQFKWFQSFTSDNETTLAHDILLQIIEKEIVARFLHSLSFFDETNGIESTAHLHGVYNPFSTNQTKHMCTFLKSLLGYMSKEEISSSTRREKTVETVSGSLLSLVKKCVGKMIVPVVNPTNIKREKNAFVTKDGTFEFDSETNDAVAYAFVVQGKELCTLVTNILQFWYPIIRDEAADLLSFVFTDIISRRILPVVQTLQIFDDCDLRRTLIGEILDAASQLLDDKEWLLQAAPLRVAAQALGLDVLKKTT